MQLKNIRLAGFKSFVDVTNLPIRGQLNVVVGPNGCGKSNIVDAIRWVVGISSAKRLRGQSMADVIFSGTEGRKPVGRAMVELTFDNQDGRVGGDYARFRELLVRRERLRDGQSCYSINATPCRRRDVTDIFLGTGLGPNPYAIIEQGMISQVIEAKPETLRVFLEEVAAISQYRERRREAEVRLHHVQSNLERISDLTHELDQQLQQLKRQAGRAKRYQQYQEEVQQLRKQLKALQWKTWSDQLLALDQRVNSTVLAHEQQLTEQSHIEQEIERFHQLQSAAQESLMEGRQRYHALDADMARIEQQIQSREQQQHRWQSAYETNERLWQELADKTREQQEQKCSCGQAISECLPRYHAAQKTLETAQSAQQTVETQMNQWQITWDGGQKGQIEQAQQIERAKAQVAHHEQMLKELKQRQAALARVMDVAQLEHLQQLISELESHVVVSVSEWEAVKVLLDRLSQQIAEQRQRNHERNAQLQRVQSEWQVSQGRYASLKVLQEAGSSTHAWLEHHNLSHVIRLGKTLRVQPGWEWAVETVLGHYFDGVCVEDILEWTDRFHFDAGSIMLLGRQCASSACFAQDYPRLSDQVQSEWPLSAWLSGVYTAENRAAALERRDRLLPQESIVTPDGFWVGPNWMRSARPVDSEGGVLARERALVELAETIASQQASIQAQQTVLQQGEAQLTTLEKQREEQQEKYQTISTKLAELKAELSDKQARYEHRQQQQEQAKKDMLQHQEAIEQRTDQLQQLQVALSTYLEKKEQDATQQDALRQEGNQYHEALQSARQLVARSQDEVNAYRLRLNTLEQQLQLLEQTLAQEAHQKQIVSERREQLESERLEEEGGQSIDEWRSEQQQYLSQREAIQTKCQSAETEAAGYQQQLDRLKLQYRNQQVQVDAHQEQLHTIRMEQQTLVARQAAIQEEEGCLDSGEWTALLDELPTTVSVEEWMQRIDALEQKINGLGAINWTAAEEYERIDARQLTLAQQKKELQAALDMLENAMQHIDAETQQKFRETYDEVNVRFKALFSQIFDGGEADLVLQDQEGELGVLIQARPPGKRHTKIHALSGGEKALTAIALVFAFFQLNPAPFCILDEVDAPLDDVNVGRFCGLLKQLSAVTQFIIVSHNKVTMAAAEHLLGVTMQEPGVSRIVSVDMEEAVMMASVES